MTDETLTLTCACGAKNLRPLPYDLTAPDKCGECGAAFWGDEPKGDALAAAMAAWKALPDDERNGERPWIMGFNAGWDEALSRPQPEADAPGAGEQFAENAKKSALHPATEAGQAVEARDFYAGLYAERCGQLAQVQAELTKVREDRDLWKQSEATCNKQYDKLCEELAKVREGAEADDLAACERAIERMGWAEIHAFMNEPGQSPYECAGGYMLRKIKTLFGIKPDRLETYREAAKRLVAEARATTGDSAGEG